MKREVREMQWGGGAGGENCNVPDLDANSSNTFWQNVPPCAQLQRGPRGAI